MISRFTILVIAMFCAISGFSQTQLQGKITDEGTGEPILFGTIALYKNDVLVTGGETDFDGNFLFSELDPGTYDVEVQYVGYTTKKVTAVLVKAGQSNKLNVAIGQGVLMDVVDVVAYKAPLVEFDNTSQGQTITAENIRSLPTKSINAIAATSAGLSSVDGGEISIRGSRPNGTDYYIDGVRVTNANLITQDDIDQMQVITGGIEAKYGDVTGGIISITTKGPSQRFSGGLELETSQYLDPYGYNLAAGNVSGPLLKNSAGESLLGFRLSGQYRKINDNNPSAFGVYRAPESFINELEKNPVSGFNGTEIPTGEFLQASDIGDPVAARPNDDDTNYNVNAKIDAKLSDNIDITLSGSYFESQNRFTVSNAWSLLNWTNNPYDYEKGYRGNFRFRHKLGKQTFGEDLTDEEKAASSTSIKNATYSLQVGYEKRLGRTEDLRHEDRLFNYGYWGKTDVTYVPSIGVVSDTATWEGQEVFLNGQAFAMQGYTETIGEFTPNLDINPTLSRYNVTNGILDDDVLNVWDLYTNVGQVYNRFSKDETDIYTINVTSGFDFLPGGSEKGRHNIQFGFNYEQRVNRFWAVAPRGLWTEAQLQANRHLTGVDVNNVLDSIDQFGERFAVYAPLSLADEFPDNKFFREVRELTGQELNEYVNVDELNPADLRLDMFSAAELIDRGLVSYYGYDYLGNKLGADVSFSDFFSSEDENGVRTFNVAPWQPIYGAGYIQDKFTYKDIIFRVGVRLDYYDANTKVLKDPYSLYEIESADAFANRTGEELPSTVGSDYKVYVAGEDSDEIVGFRQGDNWFSANGTGVSGGNVLFGGGLVFPSFQDKDPDDRNIQQRGYDINKSFEDYDPQLNFMPRLAFSFPISEDAGFFAHYDVLVQRPPSNTIQTGLDYYFFETIGRLNPNGTPANNPNLRPEKTIDYEVGFQQKLSNSSALKVSAFYKELRDMVQRRFFNNLAAPLNRYEAFGNLDFGTVKGFSFSYDMRRTGNLQLNATYTLQFADGSGSDANSSAGLNQEGDLRTLFPLSYDERHRLTGTIDYRYGSGNAYNGPSIGGVDLFADTGLNVILTGVSGRPYTSFTTIIEPLDASGIESINEARLPWVFNADLRIDKRFSVSLSESSKRNLGINLYFRVQNLFDARNVIGVYPVTGDPDDDGFITSTFGLDRIDEIERFGGDVNSYLATYQARILNPGNYTRARRLYLGVIFDF
jgi:outer membrane receptor protein involved in Fe transport